MNWIEIQRTPALRPSALLAYVILGAVGFHLACAVPALAPAVMIYMISLVELTRAATGRQAFYSGLALGLLIFIPKLFFFWNIFRWVSIALWIVLAFWHGLFVLMGRSARQQLPPILALVMIPFFWTGLEYFRSELYYLKFSWLTPGFAFNREMGLLTHLLGVYGVGLLLMLVGSGLTLLKARWRFMGSGLAIVFVLGISKLPAPGLPQPFSVIEVAGLQLEFPAMLEVPFKLDALKREYPDASIYVLSEYTFDGPVPDRVLKWCKSNQKYLVVGAKAPAGSTNYYNTAFVVGPAGEIVFEQGKAVPIQFFADGLPAAKQRVWESPWGRIGLCVCYDLSYTRVVDGLIRQGAQALIVPTMDVVEWGESQHLLHSRVAPVRGVEYRIPIFRLASSGISQVVNAHGKVEALHGFLELRGPGRLPADRVLGPICVLISAIGACLLAVIFYQNYPSKQKTSPQPSASDSL